MEGKSEMIEKIRNVLTLLDKYSDCGSFMPSEDKQHIRDDLTCFMDCLAGSYIIPKKDLTISQNVDDDYVVGAFTTTAVTYKLNGPQKKFICNFYAYDRDSFLENTKKEFLDMLDEKYKL